MFLTIDHWKMTLHALYINIMDQSSVKIRINKDISIEYNMKYDTTLCLEHIMTIGLHNYKCILIHTKETHFT
jgi:hypothetical protein